MSATKTCLVCEGQGSFVETFSVIVSQDFTYGPIDEEVTDLIMCDDCHGSGQVDDGIHLEQSGEREGNVDAWRDEMIKNHIERLWGV